MFLRNAFLSGAVFGTLCAAALHVAPAFAQPPDFPNVDTGILVENCMVRFINKTKVPAESQGKLTELRVEEGMSIKKGDVIAIIDSKQARLALKLKQAEELVAKLNAQNDVNKRDAVASEEIARTEAKAFEELYEKNAAPYWEYRKKKAEADRAKLRIELADLNENTAMAEFIAKQIGSELAQSDIEMRTVRSEFDAFVETRYAQLGEWVQPGSPIVEIVQMDRVRVEGYIPLRYAGQVHRGASVEVTVTMGGTATNPVTRKLKSTIEYVSTELDLNKRHRIWVSLPNERKGEDWLIKPGMRAEMRIATTP